MDTAEVDSGAVAVVSVHADRRVHRSVAAMIPWWGVVLACLGFSLWTLFAVVMGMAIQKTSAQQRSLIEQFNAEHPPWPEREN
jgi:hypothetical protein